MLKPCWVAAQGRSTLANGDLAQAATESGIIRQFRLLAGVPCWADAVLTGAATASARAIKAGSLSRCLAMARSCSLCE